MCFFQTHFWCWWYFQVTEVISVCEECTAGYNKSVAAATKCVFSHLKRWWILLKHWSHTTPQTNKHIEAAVDHLSFRSSNSLCISDFVCQYIQWHNTDTIYTQVYLLGIHDVMFSVEMCRVLSKQRKGCVHWCWGMFRSLACWKRSVWKNAKQQLLESLHICCSLPELGARNSHFVIWMQQTTLLLCTPVCLYHVTWKMHHPMDFSCSIKGTPCCHTDCQQVHMWNGKEEHKSWLTFNYKVTLECT